MFKPPAPTVHFVGRRGQFEWLERLLLAHEHWFQPHFVFGPAGIGKTAPVSRFLSMFGSRLGPCWIDAAAPVSREDFRAEFDKEMRRDTPRSRREAIVVIDGAETYDKKMLDGIISMVLNYKKVRALLVTTRKKPTTYEKAPVLNLAGLTRKEAGELFKSMVQVGVSESVREQILARANGNPLILKLLIGALNTGGEKGLSSALNVPIYDIEEFGEAQVIAIAKPQLVIVSSGIIEALKKEPESIYKLPPRKFEELLAELLESRGMTIELTPPTKDGGRDILAYSDSDLGKHLYLVEAKRYAKTHKVGVELVRQLYGVLCDHLATNAMLVTTSTFTKGAKEFQQRHQYEMSLKDCSDVTKWIEAHKNPSAKQIILG